MQLFPSEAPVRGLLSAYLYSQQQEQTDGGAADCRKWLPQLVEAWNGELTKYGLSDFAIGPRFFLESYLYQTADATPKIIELWRAWRY